MNQNIALLAGGDSSEWEISLNSASQIEQILDRTLYNPYKITVRNGQWSYVGTDGRVWEVDKNDFSLTIDGTKIKLTYALILIHGTPGEDGRLQGYLDMVGIPYSSCGMVSSVLTFEKSACKRAVASYNIPLAKEILIGREESYNTDEIVARLGLPLFVKPNASGSSFGVTKVKQETQLTQAIQDALQESDQALLEEYIEGREISCGVLITREKEYIFPITELICQTEFFDYEAKYKGLSEEVTPADLPTQVVQRVNEMTRTIYKALNCRGVVRIDFIIRGETPYMIEVNTVPGMSAQSIIPQQAAAMGMSMTELFNLIIDETDQLPRK